VIVLLILIIGASSKKNTLFVFVVLVFLGGAGEKLLENCNLPCLGWG